MSQSIPGYCYTNPSFCRQSEQIPDDHGDELPPPPQFQEPDELPPPPPPPLAPTTVTTSIHIQQPQNYGQGHANPGFPTRSDPDAIELDRYAKPPTDRYCYLDENKKKDIIQERRVIYDRNTRSRYEYIEDDEPLPPPQPRLERRASLTRFELMNHRQNYQFIRQGSYHGQQLQALEDRNVNQRVRRYRQDGNDRYALVPADEGAIDVESSSWINAGHSSPRGRYARVPMQDDEPPVLPDRNNFNIQPELRNNNNNNSFSSRNNLATQKLHEILTTPRKPRSKSEDRNLSPGKIDRGTPHRGGSQFTPPISATTSPTARGIVPGSSRRETPVGTPQRALSPLRAPQTSTPNKETPSARRCLPLNEQQDICPASNCGRARYSQRRGGTTSLATSPTELSQFSEPPPRYAFLESNSESMPMVIGSPKYQILSSRSESQAQLKRNPYQSVESAFIARTAVVPPLSPPSSDANTTLASGLEKNERKSAPLILVLVGILTCGLALYLSWTQGRQYYLDSAAGCGVCCALAGACRSLRRPWTGLGLAGLSALSCGGLLLLAVKSPRKGTPLHDITAGALCGVSLLGAALALLALLAPKCNLGRHRRVHSWMPRFSP
ncbi:uncharacterized protein LOC130669589 [Microplitis mediator]|uniref:uncharacterized protein LOC130669589 n=1 Tax=Microplitis mediator TaxID=375433 RepID=UPI002552F90E|nr:uncharacterized protein LOC130669589 [Microplitis mediator]